MTPGTLLLNKDFPKHDGSIGNKFLLVLNDGTVFPYITVLITSKQKNRGTVFGCQSSDRFPNFFLPKGCCYLDLNSWVQLEEYKEIEQGLMSQRQLENKLKLICTLSDDLIAAIVNCAISTPDISGNQINELRRTLANLP
ncbi:MAG: hypothetical protein A2527_12065 [Candidatus Lambdaproteobacteria bacterium RIFOXYD2_FULL_50_16]|uniref:Uncharacterized protein n=1 Tax=Candidatus Lambdaproteobacteria bacterium RIFOXYD2_FULL_50_16 TaxID=1817772 RepID=A0A1F6GD57_9PROT|nr:MAG: hypothetical protein A2527_12065 [Candidatus Lambdaproteobacteria bacterium RIFOXYD2_FULL_50_16]